MRSGMPYRSELWNWDVKSQDVPTDLPRNGRVNDTGGTARG
jgi:hypothetical protein